MRKVHMCLNVPVYPLRLVILLGSSCLLERPALL